MAEYYNYSVFFGYFIFSFIHFKYFLAVGIGCISIQWPKFCFGMIKKKCGMKAEAYALKYTFLVLVETYSQYSVKIK